MNNDDEPALSGLLANEARILRETGDPGRAELLERAAREIEGIEKHILIYFTPTSYSGHLLTLSDRLDHIMDVFNAEQDTMEHAFTLALLRRGVPDQIITDARGYAIRVSNTREPGDEDEDDALTCSVCHGDGWTADDDGEESICPECGGLGVSAEADGQGEARG